MAPKDPRRPDAEMPFKPAYLKRTSFVDPRGDFLNLFALAIGIASVVTRSKYVAWTGVIASVVASMNMDSDNPQMSALSFTIMALTLCYMQPAMMPRPPPLPAPAPST
eukprot:comp8139_c0_seq1/m.3619 comp8139_c0_seq1/g.3619  ORF comp8139_c0_seq1/g.3619 comp8139_c0_seq1/m.3619 type:complete len:108 (-) comp8139_c0_seq1:122-445(-)